MISSNIQIKNGEIIITISSKENQINKFSYHIYIDNERVCISGWTNELNFKYPCSQLGIVYAKILYMEDGKLKTSTTIKVELTLEKFINSTEMEFLPKLINRLSNSIESNKKIESKVNKFIERYYAAQIRGKTLSNYFVEKGINNIYLFSEKKNSPVARLIQAISFFNSKSLNIKGYMSSQAYTVPYNVSMTYRSNYLNVEVFNLKEDDTCLIIDVDKKYQEIFSNKPCKVIYLSDIIRELYEENIIYEPLQTYIESKAAKLFYLQMPIAKGIKNPTESERNKANISIGTVRQQLGKYNPDSLRNESQKYIDEVMAGWELESVGNLKLLKDKCGKYVNISKHNRVVPDQPQVLPSRTVYIFGNSVAYGIGSDDSRNLSGYLQKLFNKDNKYILVKNMANFSMNDYVHGVDYILSTPLKENDIVIFASHLESNKENNIKTQHLFDRPADHGEVFTDMTHLNSVGYKIIAEYLFSKLKDIIE